MGKNAVSLAAQIMRRHRLASGLSQPDASALIGYSKQTMGKIENGHTKPSLTLIKSFIDGFSLERLDALELIEAAGYADVKGIESKADRSKVDKPKPKPKPKPKTESDMSLQQAVCFYALQSCLENKMDDLTAQMILKLLEAAQ